MGKRPDSYSSLPTPLIYYGGKTTLAPLIVSNIPPHETWVDVFGGGAAVTLAKGPSKVEIYNDIGNVANFFHVLRDHGDELVRRLKLTPFSRQEFYYCSMNWPKEMLDGDEIEWARMWYTTCIQSFTHEEDDCSWHVGAKVSCGQAWVNHVNRLPAVIERFRRIQIENRDFSFILDVYDGDKTMFYCDPPYMAETRYEVGNYLHEMTYERHEELLDMLLRVKAQVIVSGYPSELYNKKLRNWRTITRTRPTAISNNSVTVRTDRTEVLWIKEHLHGLWGTHTPASSTNVSRISTTEDTA